MEKIKQTRNDSKYRMDWRKINLCESLIELAYQRSKDNIAEKKYNMKCSEIYKDIDYLINKKEN